jgi:hypothetical protein
MQARCTVLFTSGTLVPSGFAASRAENPAASRMISPARSRDGRCWTATKNAISSVSRAAAASCCANITAP